MQLHSSFFVLSVEQGMVYVTRRYWLERSDFRSHIPSLVYSLELDQVFSIFMVVSFLTSRNSP